jgi:hypothetical protein
MVAAQAPGLERSRRKEGSQMMASNRVLLAGLWILGAAGQADGAALGFTGTLAVQIGTSAPVVIPGSGVATVNGDGTGGRLTQLEIPSGAFAVSGLSVPLTLSPISGVEVTAVAGAGSFSTDSGTLQGSMPILGAARLCLFVACSEGPLLTAELPLSVIGTGGTESVTFPGGDLTITGSPWTAGVAAVGSNSVTGFARGPASGISSTAGPSGVVRLVTPVLISTTFDGELFEIPAFGILTVQFVPEPAAFLLLGSGVLTLFLLGRSRRG